jgi:hypothetical protein
MLCFDARKAESSFFFGHFRLIRTWVSIRVHDTVHCIFISIAIGTFEIVVSLKTSHTSSSASTATLPLTVARQGITSSEFAIAFWAYVRPFASM